jgi:TonB-dependent receptor
MVNPDATTAGNTNVTVRMESDGSPFPAPDRLLSFGTAGTPIDPYNLNNYKVVSGRIRPLQGTDSFRGISAKVKRHLDFLPFYSTLKVGGELRTQVRDVKSWQEDLTFNGVGGNISAAQFLDTNYQDADNGFGFSNIPWADPYAAWRLYRANPATFTASTAQQLAARRFYLQNSQKVEEKVTALFIQNELKFVDNRLNIIYGVRYEKTEDTGQGLKIDGPSPDMATLNANWTERGQAVTKSYDGYYPSINANFTITENTILRAGFAKTFGRPDFSNIIPLSRYNDTGAVVNDGIGNLNAYSVNVRNTALEPYSADNYDVTLEHYLPKAGLISGRVFMKDIENFFVSRTRDLTAQDFIDFNIDGVDSATMISQGGDITSTFNSAQAARLSGFELTYRISQLPLIPASFGKLGFFASYTDQRTTGEGHRNFTNFAPRLVNGRLDYHKGNFSTTAGVNYTSRRRTSDNTGANVGGASTGFSTYIPERVTVDVSGSYKIDKRWTIFANARNIFDEANSIVETYNDFSPAYSDVARYETYGVLINVGVKAEF